MNRILLILLISLTLLSSCQNSSAQKPNWVDNPPKAKDKIYAVGIGTSGGADIAERKARLDASAKLAELLEPAIVSVTYRIDSLVRGNDVLVERVSVVRKKVLATLHNPKTVEVSKSQKNEMHTCYILLELPQKSIAQSVIEQINQDQELQNALARSRVYKKMKKESKK